MLAGHFGLAAAVKARQPQVPLWALMLSTQLMDVIFIGLYLAGIEGFKPVPGTNGGYGNLIISADYTHSLVGALILSLVAMIVAWIPWGRLNGLLIGGMVFSHWILDLLVHRSDMPILPGSLNEGLPRLGLGLWQIPWLSALVELAIVLTGAFLYYHAAMRTAVVAERQDLKAGGKLQQNYRRQALVTSIIMAVLLIGTLAGDYFVG
jgi:membrane-bound metal-dependent hydrolase YbcI (DUF457 family)